MGLCALTHVCPSGEYGMSSLKLHLLRNSFPFSTVIHGKSGHKNRQVAPEQVLVCSRRPGPWEAH